MAKKAFEKDIPQWRIGEKKNGAGVCKNNRNVATITQSLEFQMPRHRQYEKTQGKRKARKKKKGSSTPKEPHIISARRNGTVGYQRVKGPL